MKLRPMPILAALLLLPATVALAQDDLQELDEGVVVEEPFVPQVEGNAWELTILLGYLDLGQELVGAEGLLVDVENPQEALYGDMTLDGESTSFSPQAKVAYTLGNNFAVGAALGFAVGDYQQKVGELESWTDPTDENNTLTENEILSGSYWMWTYEGTVDYYPLGGGGRLQPYLSGGVGQNHYFIDSRYIEGQARGLAFSVGGGLRIVGDELFNVKIEVRNYWTTVDYEPGDEWIDGGIPNLSGDGLVSFPISTLVDRSELTDAEYREIIERLGLPDDPTTSADDLQRVPQVFEDYEERSYSNLYFSLGLTAAF